MIKRLYFILFAFFWASCLFAQTPTVNSGWSMRYVKAHYLMAKGAETNVVDLDLEWPDEIDFQDVAPLRAYLAQTLFDVPAATFPAAYQAFMDRQGTEVTKNFDSIPDDSKFCYSTLKLTYLGGETNRYVSFRVSADVSPQPNSSQKSRQVETLITYDLLTQKVLTAKDLLRDGSAYGGQWNGDVYQIHLFTETDEFFMLLKECCLIPDGNLFAYIVDTENEGDLSMVGQILPHEFAKSYFSKEAKNLLKAKISGSSRLSAISLEVNALMGQYDLASDNAATTDSLTRVSRDIMKYIGSNFKLPQGDESLNGTMYVGFVLDSLGYVREPRILKSMGATLDRELVQTLLMMPRQNPITVDGQKKSVELRIPVRIKYQ